MKQKIDWHITTFWLIAFAIAWSIGFTVGVDDEAISAAYSPIVATTLIYLPKFAFTISGVILFFVTGQSKEMWTRLFNFRVKWTWYAIAYLAPALLYFASAWLSSEGPLSPRFDSSTLWMLTVASQSGILFYFIFRGGLGEEIGLRGFALTRLQTRHTPLDAALIIGFWWGLWHLPAWLERSTFEIAVTWLAVMAFSMIFTWFYNNTNSLPIVMLLHAALNSFDDVFENIFPSLLNIDWELPYIAGVLLIGIAIMFWMFRQQIHEQKEVLISKNTAKLWLPIGIFIGLIPGLFFFLSPDGLYTIFVGLTSVIGGIIGARLGKQGSIITMTAITFTFSIFGCILGFMLAIFTYSIFFLQ